MVSLTIIPRGRVGYEMIDNANEAHSAELAIIISYPTSASGITVLLKRPQNLVESPRLEQTGKDKGLPLFTCHTSIKTVNARTDSPGLHE